ncbi:hypothetical protein BGZ65_003708 [Modicella reniformis]|uniref:Uncharacterized protein n=1 Tax=Modicella reniformis TaxID=1440133 RepID=A0A9P6M968_9FUNG|nr:hypothetical protein BGZ65_003708 [Modicella reniformis]
MNNDPDKQPTQSFQNRLTGEAVDIPTVIYPKTGGCIVLWENIQSGFKNAESILNTKSLVPFMKDDNLKQIIPKRIASHSGVVLDVLVEGNGQVDSTREVANLSQVLSTGKKSKDCDEQPTNQSLVMNPKTIPEVSQPSIFVHIHT